MAPALYPVPMLFIGNSEIGRWQNVDPLADLFPGISPYVYCINNPINIIDPTGMSGDPIAFEYIFPYEIVVTPQGNSVDTYRPMHGNKNYNNEKSREQTFGIKDIFEIASTAFGYAQNEWEKVPNKLRNNKIFAIQKKS